MDTRISIGIIAWNEESAVRSMLQSLFEQTLFSELASRQIACEILLVANGCTDRTASVASEIFEAQLRNHPFRAAFSCQVIDLAERGKINAWNRYVHEFSAKSAQYLFLADADIVLHSPPTLWNMYSALENNSKASISTDTPIKDVALRRCKGPLSLLSLAASRMTQSADAQLTGQLYCIKASVARNIYMPRDLAACEDGFIKSLACTYFLTRPVSPSRIVIAPDASHVFEAYKSPRAILNNQKRQIIGQTIVHLLIDRHLPQLTLEQKLNLAETLRAREAAEPDWLKRIIDEHVRSIKYPWKLIPGIVSFRFQRLARMKPFARLTHLPVAIAAFLISMIACFRAFRALRRGSINYWPGKTTRVQNGEPAAESEHDSSTVTVPKIA